MTVRAVRAACNLEFGSTNLTDVRWNRVVVKTPSGETADGHCRVGDVDISFGTFGLLPSADPTNKITFGCSEHDENGGDCHLLGQMLCSE